MSPSEPFFKNATPGSFSDFPSTTTDIFVEGMVRKGQYFWLDEDVKSHTDKQDHGESVTIASLKTESARSAFVIAFNALGQGREEYLTDGSQDSVNAGKVLKKSKSEEIVSALQNLGHTSAVAKAIVQGAQVILEHRNRRDTRFKALNYPK